MIFMTSNFSKLAHFRCPISLANGIFCFREFLSKAVPKASWGLCHLHFKTFIFILFRGNVDASILRIFSEKSFPISAIGDDLMSAGTFLGKVIFELKNWVSVARGRKGSYNIISNFILHFIIGMFRMVEG